jgi:hypothetical protein
MATLRYRAVTFMLRAHQGRDTDGLPAGVDIAEVIDFAGPPLPPLGVAHLDPPYGLGLLGNRQCARVRRLISTGTVGSTSDVLLIGLTVDPDLPIAASDVA